MDAAAFDTLRTARNLEAAGIERAQAEAIATAIGHGNDRTFTKAAIDAAAAPLASKDDLRTAIDAAVEPLASKDDLRAAVEPLASKADLYRALWIQTGVMVGSVVAIVQLLG